MEGSGIPSVPRDADDIDRDGPPTHGLPTRTGTAATGTAASAALTAESPPVADAETGNRPARRGARGFRFPASSRSGLILTVCCVAQFMVILDLSIVNVALPSIQSSLNFTSSDLQWVVDAYAIAFAGFLMLGGRADE
jgi:hypothetical protein